MGWGFPQLWGSVSEQRSVSDSAIRFSISVSFFIISSSYLFVRFFLHQFLPLYFVCCIRVLCVPLFVHSPVFSLFIPLSLVPWINFICVLHSIPMCLCFYFSLISSITLFFWSFLVCLFVVFFSSVFFPNFVCSFLFVRSFVVSSFCVRFFHSVPSLLFDYSCVTPLSVCFEFHWFCYYY